MIRELTLEEISLILNITVRTIYEYIKKDDTFPVTKKGSIYYINLDKVGSWLDTYTHSKRFKIRKTYKNYKVYMDGEYSAILINNKNVHLHRVVWEDNFGKIPKGYVVHHKDENKLNWDITNLELLSRSEHIKKHKDVVHRKGVPVMAKKGKLVRRFDSIEIAANECNTYPGSIHRCFTGKQKKANGWQFYKIGGDSYSIL